jgi:rRNA maturation RNase YbeY
LLGAVISNRQKCVPLNPQFLGSFVDRLSSLLRLGRRHFDVTLVDDAEIERLNLTFRGIAHATDVLSFPWQHEPEVKYETPTMRAEWSGFLGDIVISAETARRNSIAAGLPFRMEIRQLVLHGLLHLLGYDHETDQGEMERLEVALKRELGISGRRGCSDGL